MRNLIVSLCCFAGVACSSQSVPNKPVEQAQTISSSISKSDATKFAKSFIKGDKVRVTELISVNDCLTVKADTLYQNRHGKFVFGRNSLLKFKCDSTVTLTEVNGISVSIPVILHNKDHVPTDCEASNGAVKSVRF